MSQDSTTETSDFEETPDGVHRSGYVAFIGRPNAGKSTLLNALLHQHLSIVTSRPQTTRHRILGILDRPDCQVLFLDTPGLMRPRDEMHEFMRGEIQRAIEDADVVVLTVDGIKSAGPRERAILDEILPTQDPASILLLCNKMDCVPPPDVMALQESLKKLELPEEIEILYASALRETGIEELMESIVQRLPEGPKYYEGADGEPAPLTDRTERFMAAELIREQAVKRLRDELPHGLAVAIMEMKDDPGRKKVLIEATIVVERDSQRGILIGKGGLMLKNIGSNARQEIESMLDRPVYLSLHVTAIPGWRKNKRRLRELGYDPGTVY